MCVCSENRETKSQNTEISFFFCLQILLTHVLSTLSIKINSVIQYCFLNNKFPFLWIKLKILERLESKYEHSISLIPKMWALPLWSNSGSVAKLCPIPQDTMLCSMPNFLSCTISQSLLKFMSLESVMPSSHLISVIHFSFCLKSFHRSFLMCLGSMKGS